MNIRTTILSAVLATCAASAASATVYDCTLKTANGSWVPEQIVIEHTKGQKSAQVIDGMIQHFMGGPIEATVTTDNAKRTAFTWVVKGADDGRQNYAAKFVFRATYLKRNGKMSVYAKPAGYANDFSGFGKCKLG